MGAIMTSIVKNLIEVLVFVLIAWGGVILGKKMRANKNDGK